MYVQNCVYLRINLFWYFAPINILFWRSSPIKNKSARFFRIFHVSEHMFTLSSVDEQNLYLAQTVLYAKQSCSKMQVHHHIFIYPDIRLSIFEKNLVYHFNICLAIEGDAMEHLKIYVISCHC